MGLLFIAVLSGALLTYVYEGESCLSARLCAGAPTGIAALSMAALLLASLFGGVDQSVILLATGLAACPLFLPLRADYRRRIKAEVTAAISAILHPSRTAVALSVL